MSTTENLTDLSRGDRRQLIELLDAWDKQGLPKGFSDEKVKWMMNTVSGFIFLTNEDYQTALMNGDKLEIWHSCYNCGREGFQEDCQLNDEGCNECNPEEEEEEES